MTWRLSQSHANSIAQQGWLAAVIFQPRSYDAVRHLCQHGFDARNLSGGWQSARHRAGLIESDKQARNEAAG